MRTSSSFLWISAGFLAACLVVGLGIGFYLGAASVKGNPGAPKPTALILQPLSSVTATVFQPATAVQITDTALPTATAVQPLALAPTASAAPKTTQPPTVAPVPTLAARAQAPADPWIEEQLKKMSLEQKASQVIMTGVTGSSATPENCSLMKTLLPGGVAYTGPNVTTAASLRALSAGLQDCLKAAGGIPLLVGLDHEGQYIHRFTAGATLFPAAMAVGASNNPNNAYQAANLSGQELLYTGVNLVLGPDADVLTRPNNAVISQRSYGGDPARVAQNVVQAVKGYQAAGIIALLKHFPGHGGTDADSHTVLPVDHSDLASIENVQLVPFREGIAAGAEVVMVGHVSFPKLDPKGLPASLSKPVFDLLRGPLGFKGLALSDAMGMGAVTQGGRSVPEASLMAVQAGMDMLIITSPALAVQTRDLLVSAVQSGKLPQARLDEAVRRVLALKAAYGLKTLSANNAPAPNLAANQKVSDEIGRAAVSVVTDSRELVPLPANVRRVLLVGPVDAVVQNPGFYTTLTEALKARGIEVKVTKYQVSSTENPDYLGASSYDLVIFLSYEAHLYADTWQINVVNAIINQGTRLVVVALKGPFDLLNFPLAPVYLATMGTTPGQARGLADLLVGNEQTGGKIPVLIK